MKDQNIFLGLAVILAFSMLVSVLTVGMIYSYTDLDPELLGTMTTEEIQLYVAEKNAERALQSYLLPVISFIGLFIGTLSYRFMGSPEAKVIRKDGKAALKLLSGDERKAVEKILECGGKCQQLELTRLPGMNKVRTHRLLSDLEKKGIIKKENYGKVNMIVLDKGLQELLKD